MNKCSKNINGKSSTALMRKVLEYTLVFLLYFFIPFFK